MFLFFNYLNAKLAKIGANLAKLFSAFRSRSSRPDSYQLFGTLCG
jgi:hypothetical protein